MGALLCILSAAAFGAMAIFGKLAYDEGVEVGDLLLFRFSMAAAALLAIALARGALRGLPRRAVLASLAMGAVGYATQSGLFFSALERMDASLLALILYTYPVLVVVAAVAIGRERASARRVAALVVASLGVVLVLAGAASGSFDAFGAAMGFGAALAYTTYILVGDRVVAGVPLLALGALVCTGAAATFWVAGLVRGGPSAAAILSVFEPVVTVALAAAAFGESLAPVQLAGGILVLSAVVVMQWPGRGVFWRDRVAREPALEYGGH